MQSISITRDERYFQILRYSLVNRKVPQRELNTRLRPVLGATDDCIEARVDHGLVNVLIFATNPNTRRLEVSSLRRESLRNANQPSGLFSDKDLNMTLQDKELYEL